MKKILLFTTPLLFLLPVFSNAQTPSYLWAKSAGGGTTYDYGYSVSTDQSGNVFVTGSFQAPTITFGTTTLTNADNTGLTADIFIVKYDAAGNVLWAKNAGGTTDDAARSVSTDPGGNAYITGYFSGPIITFGTTTLTNAGSADIFIVKYDGSGNVFWAKSAGGTSAEAGYNVSADPVGGGVYLTGNFNSPTIIFGTTTLTNAGGNVDDICIAKYDAVGNVLWAKSAGGIATDDGVSSFVDPFDGSLLVTGYFYSPTITFGTTTLTNAGGSASDFFVMKYDALGNVLWANRAGGTAADNGTGVSVNPADGSLLVAGYFFSPTITFGTTTLTNADNTGNYADVFIVKYDFSGNLLWAKRAGGTFSDYGMSVSVDPTNGGLLLTGFFYSPIITFGTTTLTNADNTGNTADIFIVKYDFSGNVIWANRAGGTFDDAAYGVSADPAGGSAAVTGFFASASISFGTTTLTNTDITTGSYDMFAVKICQPAATITASGATTFCQGGSVTLTASTANTYSWSNSAITQSITVATSGNYSVANDVHGCSATSAATSVIVNPLPTVTANATATLVCVGKPVTLTGSGAITYSWTGGVTNGVAFPATIQTYTVTGTDGNNCTNIATISISVPQLPTPNICMLTADSLALNNIIYWDKTLYPTTDSFIVYRYDVISTTYLKIGAAPKDSGHFIDTKRSIGGPNGGDPAYGSWQYKLALKDTCGNISLKSPYHQSIFVQENTSNFSWNAYTIEAGQSNPLTGYSFLRDDINTGAWHVLISTTGLSASDPTYTSFPNGNWRVDALGFNCTATARSGNNSIAGAIVRSKSNITNNRTTKINQNNIGKLTIYPNPNNGIFVIETTEKSSLQIVSLTGELVLSQILENTKNSIDASVLRAGIYSICISSKNGNTNSKLVIVK